MKALVGAFNQEKALVEAFSVIVKTGCGTDGALHSTILITVPGSPSWIQTLDPGYHANTSRNDSKHQNVLNLLINLQWRHVSTNPCPKITCQWINTFSNNIAPWAGHTGSKKFLFYPYQRSIVKVPGSLEASFQSYGPQMIRPTDPQVVYKP